MLVSRNIRIYRFGSRMVNSAVISTGGAEALSPLTQFGGLSLLKRALLTAQRAGARVCYVLARNEEAEVLQRSLENDTRLTADIVWITPHGPLPPSEPLSQRERGRGEGSSIDSFDPAQDRSDAGHCLVFSCDTLFRPALIQDVGQAGEDGWLVRGGPNHATLAVVPLAQLSSLVVAWTQEESLPAEHPEQLPVLSPSPHFLHRLTQHDDYGAIEQAFLLTLENPHDGLVDAYLNRTCSRLLTRLFLRTPLTPNQITVLSCLTGLLGASCFLLGSYGGTVLGALLLQFSTVLDCVDGEVARVKMLESPLGEWLDISLDTVVHIAIFLGVGVAVWKQDAIAAAPLLGGLLAAAAFISFPLVTRAEKTQEQGRARGGWEDVWLEKMVAGLTSRDYSLLVLLCAIAGKLAWFLWAAAIGAQVFWVVLLSLLWKAGRLRRSA